MATLHEIAAWLGRFHWLESRLYEVIGNWLTTTPEPEVKALLGAQCYHHAWHAELWAELFPSGYGLDLTQACSPGDSAPAHALDQLASLAGTEARLAGLYRVVVPRKIAAYRTWRAKANPVTDGALVRWLRLVLVDEGDDLLEGDYALQQLLQSPEAVKRAATAQSELETSLIVGGGLFAGLPNL